MKKAVVLLLALLVTSCGLQPEGTRQSQKRAVRFQGKTAAEWAPGLHDADPETSQAAATALQQIGEEGVPFLLEGMDSSRAAVRWQAAQSFPVQMSSRFRDELIPRLKKLLRDESGPVRARAANIIAFGQVRDLFTELESAAENEQDRGVRKIMLACIDRLKSPP